MLNYVTNRFEEFSSEMKQTSNMPLINEIVQPSAIFNKDLITMNKVTGEQTIASKQSDDIKRFVLLFFCLNKIEFFSLKIIISISNKSLSYACFNSYRFT